MRCVPLAVPPRLSSFLTVQRFVQRRRCGTASGGVAGVDALRAEVAALADALNTLAHKHSVLEAELSNARKKGEDSRPIPPVIAAGATAADGVPANILRMVVKVFAAVAPPNHILPWQRKIQQQVSGTGFIVDIARRLLMTNTHVVGHASSVEVRRHGVGTKYAASIVYLAADSDLALLHVESDEFWAEGAEAMRFDSGSSSTCNDPGLGQLCALGPVDALPALQSDVKVVGFPWGGDQLSITSGVVSRVDMTSYGTDQQLLAVQIDAAINSGNSGGPALVDNRVIGIAFQTLVAASNIGYLIPACVAAVCARAYVAACAKHHHHSGTGDLHVVRVLYHGGFPRVGIVMQPLHNASLRAHYNFSDKQRTGCLVDAVYPRSNASGVLCKGDILMSVNGHSIANDGTVEWTSDRRMSFAHFVHMTPPGDIARFEVWRAGAAHTLAMQADPEQPKVPCHIFNDRFREVLPYRIFGGCVFSEVTLGYVKEWGDQDWVNNAPRGVTHLLFPTLEEDDVPDRESYVVLCQMLPHPVNLGYESADFVHRWLRTINGTPIRSLDHAASCLATATAEGETVELILTNSFTEQSIVLDAAAAARADQQLAEAYGMPRLERLPVPLST